MLKFNILTSLTFWGAFGTAVTAVASADWSHGIPFTVIIGAITALIGVIGARNAVAANGVGSTAAIAQAHNGVTP